MIYFTSDLHLNNYNIMKYEPVTRPFGSVAEMNDELIKRWNETVSPEDTVYILGDFIMGMADQVEETLNKLNGKKILIRGNHDTRTKLEIYNKLGIEVKLIEYIQYKGRFFILCHFPLMNEDFLKMVTQNNSEVILLYGHIHSNAPKGYVNGTYHVGVDTNNLTPISIEQIWQESWPEEQMTPEVVAYKAAAEAGECPEEKI